MTELQEFHKAIDDFITNFSITFPEFKPQIAQWWNVPLKLKNNEPITPELMKTRKDNEVKFIFKYCKQIYLPSIFNIIYSNESIFDPKDNTNTCFLPNIDFKHIWQLNISSTTRESIWKHLQMVLLPLLTSATSMQDFGEDGEVMFQALSENDITKQLERIVKMMSNSDTNTDTNTDTNSNTNIDTDDDNASNTSDDEETKKNREDKAKEKASGFIEKLNKLMDGKIGKFAKEIAIETTTDMGIDINDESLTPETVISKLLHDPQKTKKMMETLNIRLQEKINNGEIKESEILEEGKELLMNMGDMKDILSSFGMSMPKGSKVNLGAMKKNLDDKTKKAKLKERLKNRINKKNSTKMETEK